MKGIITFLVVLLGGWMAGAEYVWLCHVKDHCGSATEVAAAAPTRGDSGPAENSQSASEQPPPALPPTSSAARLPDSAPEPVVKAPVNESRADTQPAAGLEANAETIASAGQPPASGPAPASLTLQLDGQTLIQPMPFGFAPDQWQISNALNGTEALSNLARLLNQRKELELELIGQFLSSETGPGSFDDIGLARANSLRDALVDMGVARDRIQQRSVALTGTEAMPGIELVARDVSPLLGPRNMYFDTASAAPRGDSDLELYIQHIAVFLSRHRGASLRVTGHTDNTGETLGNEALGLTRAREVAELLGQRGLPTTRIRIGSKGQQQPAADNSTASGRAANRRVEIELDMGRR